MRNATKFVRLVSTRPPVASRFDSIRSFSSARKIRVVLNGEPGFSCARKELGDIHLHIKIGDEFKAERDHRPNHFIFAPRPDDSGGENLASRVEQARRDQVADLYKNLVAGTERDGSGHLEAQPAVGDVAGAGCDLPAVTGFDDDNRPHELHARSAPTLKRETIACVVIHKLQINVARRFKTRIQNHTFALASQKKSATKPSPLSAGLGLRHDLL